MTKEKRPHIDISKTHDQRKVEEFAQALEEILPGSEDANVPERWEHFKNAVYNTTLSTFVKKTKKMADWFEAHSEELMPAIEEKRRALAAYKACPSEYNLQALRVACSQVQQAARCSNDYWFQLCSQVQILVDTGNIKGMYDGINQALGPIQKKSAPLKSTTGMIIQDRAQQMAVSYTHLTLPTKA